jgi:hypothetical protein
MSKSNHNPWYTELLALLFLILIVLVTFGAGCAAGFYMATRLVA